MFVLEVDSSKCSSKCNSRSRGEPLSEETAILSTSPQVDGTIVRSGLRRLSG